MSSENQETIRLLNTAIIKSKERNIDYSYEEKLSDACGLPSVRSLAIAISHLSESEHISRDQAAIKIVETIRELDRVWSDYVMMEGMRGLGSLLKEGSS